MKKIIIIFLCLMFSNSCATSFRTKNKQKISFWLIPNQEIFTDSDLLYIRTQLPKEYRNSFFYVIKFNYDENYPLYLFTRDIPVSKKKTPISNNDVYIEIPIIKIKGEVLVNSGNCDEDALSRLEQTFNKECNEKLLKFEDNCPCKQYLILEKLLLTEYDKESVNIMLERFKKGFTAKTFKETVLYRKVRHEWNP